MSELSEVFEVLKKSKLCKSQYAFSRDYLRKAPNYFSSLECNKIEPSTHVLMTLHLSLYERATQSEVPTTMESYQAKQSLIALSNRVLSVVKVRCSK